MIFRTWDFMLFWVKYSLVAFSTTILYFAEDYVPMIEVKTLKVVFLSKCIGHRALSITVFNDFFPSMITFKLKINSEININA